MINKQTNKLHVFEDFIVDRKLPKHKREGTPIYSSGFSTFGDSNGIEGVDQMTPIFTGRRGGGDDPALWDGISLNVKNEMQRQFAIRNYHILMGHFHVNGFRPLTRLTWWLVRRLYLRKQKRPEKSVAQFFVDIKMSKESLQKADQRLVSYQNAVKNAEAMGQRALVEKIKREEHIVGCESKLFSIDLNEFITEEQLVTFVKKSERGLRLDWIKNFTRQIPEDVMKMKQQCDELKIFDNYCILHYDPEGKATELTKKEKEKKKDPILFGLLEGSRRLYFVGDWIDEHCDLQFRDLVKVIGKQVVKSQELTAEIKLPKE